jgi:leader peptidase (prepilin peptidase)/N-methyltransferase
MNDPGVFTNVAVFLFGCCMGSFFNVAIHRLPREESLVRPGSRCPSCGHAIAFYDNVPILSWLWLRGRCRRCKASISVRYPVVEGLTGLVTLALFLSQGWGVPFVVLLVFVYALIVIAFIDLDTYLIPDVLSLTGIAVGFLGSLVSPHLSWSDSLIGILFGGGILYLVAWAYRVIRHQDGMGGGDIKLLAMIGAFIGWAGVVFTLFAASIAGALVGVAVMLKTRQGMEARVPFGPVLALGALGYVLGGEALVGWYWGRF